VPKQLRSDARLARCRNRILLEMNPEEMQFEMARTNWGLVAAPESRPWVRLRLKAIKARLTGGR
jgi:hypothetical protein